MRGSSDFADLAAYQAFLAETIARKNARRAGAVAIELKADLAAYDGLLTDPIIEGASP
jgi:hypothetical protein